MKIWSKNFLLLKYVCSSFDVEVGCDDHTAARARSIHTGIIFFCNVYICRLFTVRSLELHILLLRIGVLRCIYFVDLLHWARFVFDFGDRQTIDINLECHTLHCGGSAGLVVLLLSGASHFDHRYIDRWSSDCLSNHSCCTFGPPAIISEIYASLTVVKPIQRLELSFIYYKVSSLSFLYLISQVLISCIHPAGYFECISFMICRPRWRLVFVALFLWCWGLK